MSYKEQIMSKDEYPRMFSKSNGGHCVYYPSNIFLNTSNRPRSIYQYSNE